MAFTIIGLIAMWKEYQRKLGKLGEKLNEFYYNKVVIDKASMHFATNILNSVNQALKKYLDINHKYYPVGEFILQGSVAEGLKVCKPNEFDVSIPVLLPDDLFEAVKDSPGIGKFRYKNEEDYSNLWTYLDVHEKHGYDEIETHNQRFLSPQKVGEKIKEMIFEALDSADFKSELDSAILLVDEAKVHDYEFGPATEIKVLYKTSNGFQASFIIDYVVQVQIDREKHVISPYYSKEKYVNSGYGGYYSTYFEDPLVYWRVSNSAREKAIISYVGLEGTKPLLIYKALILLNEKFKNPILGTYHMKNIFFLLAFRSERNICLCCKKQYQTEEEYLKDLKKSSFLSSSLPEQFIGFTKYMYQFFEKGEMPWFFHQHDMMKFDSRDEKKARHFDIPKIQASVRDYLKDIVEKEHWDKLIEDAADHVSLRGCPFRKGRPYMKKFN